MLIRNEQLLLAKRLVAFLGLWLVLSGGSAAGLAFGAAASAAAAWVSVRLAPPGERRLRLLRLAALAPGFSWRALAGGLDVARRAFDPRLPLRPGWIRYPPKLPAGAPRVVLGGEISLLPGTLIAGEKEGRLLVHCLDTELPVARQIADEEERFARALEG